MYRVAVHLYIPDEYALACPYIRVPIPGEEILVWGAEQATRAADDGDEALGLPRVIVRKREVSDDRDRAENSRSWEDCDTGRRDGEGSGVAGGALCEAANSA